MKIEKKDLAKSQVEITVELSWAEFKPYLEQGARKASAEIKVEGFRPGKVPYEILKQKIGEMTILEEAARFAINKTIETAIEKNTERQPVGSPRVDIVKLAPDNPLVYKVVLAILPEIKLGDYKNFKIKAVPAEVKDEEVDKMIEQLREMRAQEKITDREIGAGDKAIVKIEMFLDKVPIEGGQSQDTAVIIGQEYLVPGFGQKLIGAKKGDMREFSLPYPADYHQQNLAGKMVEFKVKIKEAYSRKLPELNEEFFQGLGLKNLDELKKNLRTNLELEKKQAAEQETELKILDKIVSGSRFGDIPEMLVDHEAKIMLGEIEHGITRQGGKFEDYLSSLGKNRDQFTLDLLPEAVKRVKSALLIREIALAEKIKVSEDEINKKVEELIKQYKDYDKVKERVKEPSYKMYLQNTMTNRKVIEKLKEWNVVK